MAKKKEIETEQHFCGDCGNGTWYKSDKNKDIQGLPICCLCKFHKWAKVRSMRACENWKPKKMGEMIITPHKQMNINDSNLAKMKPHKF